MFNSNNSTALVEIREHEGKQAVSGRELHSFLEIGRDYTNWFKQMVEYGFEEDQDFTPILAKSTGGRPSIDHVVTIDMAKELSMIQRTERGKQARQYFIEVEKRARTGVQAVPQGQELLALAVIEAQTMIAAKDEQIAELAPKAEYVDAFVADSDLRLLRNVAKSLDMTESALRADLLSRKWIYAEYMTRWSDSKGRKETITRYSPYSHKAEYFTPVPNHYAPRFKGEVMHTLKVTPQGAVAIARLYGKHLTAVEQVA